MPPFLPVHPSLHTPPHVGERQRLPALPPAADALLLAQLAQNKTLLVIITASPLDAQRLRDEIAWFSPQLRIGLLPDWETLPYDNFSPHQDLISERLSTFHALARGQCDVLLLPASTAIARLAPPAFLSAHTFFLATGETLPLDRLRAQLTLGGYQFVSQVVTAGEYSIRGGLVDLFPMGAALPYRIEFDDDVVQSMRCFDPDTQRTLYPVTDIHLLPAREFPLSEAGRAKFRSRFREIFEGDASRISLYRDVSAGGLPSGIEYYLPLFFDETSTLFDYLPVETQIVLHRDVQAAIVEFLQDTHHRYKLIKNDRAHPVLAPQMLYLSDESFFTSLRRFSVWRLPDTNPALKEDTGTNDPLPLVPLPPVTVDRKADYPLEALRGFLSAFSGRVLILAHSPGRLGTVQHFLSAHDIEPVPVDCFADFCATSSPLIIACAPLSAGFCWRDPSLAIITENELYAYTERPARRRTTDQSQGSLEGWLRDLSELSIGDPVVHETHGIGHYRGLVQLACSEEQTGEFLHLEYAEAASLYVPVSQLTVISRYCGADPDSVVPHRLGSGQWDRAKRRAAEQIHDTAAELLDLYARRSLRDGLAFDYDKADLEAFTAGFAFEETPDQMAAIDAVIHDMRAGKPMDRLVCGDVGFGKTEVALRAAFIAVASGRQVALLCPTTLLCEQHYQTFCDRFALVAHSWPAVIAELSRFKSAAEQDQAIKDLAAGKIDILIGTHRLLQKDVRFSRLGLVIIDEEHRFGVRQKETLKALRTEVDVLSLTATPIPRSLGLALEGIRDFSVISTPPQRRLAIKTFVSRWSEGLIREAALREFKRGGQIYFLHNEVSSILNMRDKLSALLPEARIAVGHGQLPERELERIMREFTQQKHNVLLCSTIIETGLDNPHANTIIINRADKFGLAQLHQLRGRVGRSHHQAFAYLLTHPDAKPSAAAQRRLEAISAMEELGAGFYLAMHDLEIRGAGEILGENQSGQVHEIGFALYANMLNTAVAALKRGEKIPDLSSTLSICADVDLGSPALLPNDYCPDVHHRLVLYKRLSACETNDDILALQEELVDRFGPLPPPAQTLIDVHQVRLAARPLGILKIEALDKEIRLQFTPSPPIDPGVIIGLIQKDRQFKLAGTDRLVWHCAHPDQKKRVRALFALLATLSKGKSGTQ
jgi:transcription-repair coupling factor (superfamily II helicase)